MIPPGRPSESVARRGFFRWIAAPRPAGRISISAECLGCTVCEYVCARGAIAREETRDGRIALRFDPALCDACGACARACLPKAISVRPGANLAARIPGAAEVLAVLEERNCPSCDQRFHSARAGPCPRCRRFPDGSRRIEGRSIPSPTRRA